MNIICIFKTHYFKLISREKKGYVPGRHEKKSKKKKKFKKKSKFENRRLCFTLYSSQDRIRGVWGLGLIYFGGS